MLERGPDGRKIIRIEMPEPEPEPPDGECAVCGGAVPGWSLHMYQVVPMCWACESAGVSRLRLGAADSFEFARHFPKLREAPTVLYLLEQEIKHGKAGSRAG